MIDLEFIEIPEHLRPFLRKITVFKSKGRLNFLQKVTPSPYVCLSYNLRGIPEYMTSKKNFHFNNRLNIAGPKTDNNIYVKYNCQLHQILIEFKPCIFYLIYGRSPLLYNNQLVKLQAIDKTKIQKKLENELLHADNTGLQIEIIGNYLAEKIKYNYRTLNQKIQDAAVICQNKKGVISKNELLDSTFLCERHFNRLFKKWTGISPKQYAKLVQLHAIIETLSSNKNLKLQDVAYMYDFFDAAHFIKYFRNLTQSCPTVFLKSRNHIAMDYYHYMS